SLSFLSTLIAHLVVFLLLFAIMDVVASMAKLAPPAWKGKSLFFGQMAVVVVLIALALRHIIFPPISFGGAAAFATATVLSLTLVLFAAGVGLRARASDNTVENGLDLLLNPLNLEPERNPRR